MRRYIVITALTMLGLTFVAAPGRAQTTATGSAAAQEETREETIRERVYVSTDKDNYLAGQIVWMKLITTDTAGAPQVFSKVGYVELVGERESHVQARIDLRDGTGEGTIVIPATLPTGWYRLVGYTRWMRNEGPEVFFDKRVGIVNPAIGEVPRGGAGAADSAPPAATATTAMMAATTTATTTAARGSITVTADRDIYSPRDEVRLEVLGIPDDIHTLSVSVTAADPLGGFPRPGLGVWRPAPATNATSDETDAASSAKLSPEWEGPIVTGQLMSRVTGERVYSPVVEPLVSFPGNSINMFAGNLSPDGSVVFRTARTAGHDDIVTSMFGSDSEPWRIDVDDPFVGPGRLVRPLPTFPVEAIDNESVRNASFAMQVQYSYTNDSLALKDRVAPLFNEAPRNRYLMEEWRRFATMNEVFIEFIQLAQFRRSGANGDKQSLYVINPEFGSVRANALVLLDGVLIVDHDIIYNYNPLLIDRIDIYPGMFTFGNNVFFGVVALYTENNSYPELNTDSFTQIESYASPQARRLFYAPDHSDPARVASRLPDFRHTLYWDADVATRGDGSAGVRFHTSDLVGTWQVVVEGITAAGEAVSAVCQLEVR